MHSSPANAFLNSDTQQNSISSHCPVEIRPDSNSAVSSHGSNSVHSVHMHSIGSVEGVEPCSSTDLNSGLASLGNVNIGTCSERVNQAFIHNLHVTSGNSSEVGICSSFLKFHYVRFSFPPNLLPSNIIGNFIIFIIFIIHRSFDW